MLNGDSMERSGDETEVSHSMGENEDEGELTESEDEHQSISRAVESTVVQPVKETTMGVIDQSTDERRIQRESSLDIIRQVRPRIPPPVRQCKVELRGEEERGESSTKTQSTSESTSHNELHNTTSSDASSIKETPSLRLKQEVPENPFVSPPTVPIRSHTSVTPSALMIKTEPQTPTSGHSVHNYSNPSSAGVIKKKWTPVDATETPPLASSSYIPFSLSTPSSSCNPVPTTTPSPDLFPSLSSPSSLSHPSSSGAHHSTTSFNASPRGIDNYTQNILAAKTVEINNQIIHINSIKQMAIPKVPPLALGHLSAPLPTCSNSIPLSMEIFESECRKVSNEVHALEMRFNDIDVPSNEYFRVSNLEVGITIERILTLVKKRVEEAENRWKMTTDSVEKRTKNGQGTPLRRKISKISGKSKELGVKTGEKRNHPDSILPAEKSASPKKRRLINRESMVEGRDERREERMSERRESDEEPSTSRGRKYDETDRRRSESRWCPYCKKKTSHTATYCSVYKTYEARRARLAELKLCFHCLDIYNPQSCNRKEHMRQCPNCKKHSSHVSLCKFLNKKQFD
ncbi:hypothetical protein PENTCL1PPCAC_11735 [Pristionchus entomophagus]|uniref:TAZ-type domain-containing protein n=1 Tax=Pristionchus entomophagus TaxID=358040 RepID=A0AAV5T399_9BILA|nr:hypothetical protein PENTCL1PPCAC_11735 [Pristionchus entomophagus]